MFTEVLMNNQFLARSNMITISGKTTTELAKVLSDFPVSQADAYATNPNGSFAARMLKNPLSSDRVQKAATPVLPGFAIGFTSLSNIRGHETLVATGRNTHEIPVVAEVRSVFGDWLHSQKATEVGLSPLTRPSRAYYGANGKLQPIVINKRQATYAYLGVRQRGVIDIIAAAGKCLFHETIEGTKTELSAFRWDEAFTGLKNFRSLSNYGGGVVAGNYDGQGGGVLLNFGEEFTPGAQAQVLNTFTPLTAKAIIALTGRTNSNAGHFVTLKGRNINYVPFALADKMLRHVAAIDTKLLLGRTV